MLKNMKIATWLMLMLLLLGLMPMGTGAIAFYFMQQNGNSIGRMSTFSDEEAAAEPLVGCFAANADADRQHGVRAHGADGRRRYP